MTPQFYGPDGTLRTDFIFSTSAQQRFFTGTCDAQTAYMEISVRGAAWVQDPNLVTFEGSQFTIPNPSAYPQGLKLFPGSNVIQVRSVLTSGSTTNPGSIQATVIPAETDLGIYMPPSGILVERLDGAVKIVISNEALATQNLRGLNLYATTQPGGGTDGYFKVNPELIQAQDALVTEKLSTLGTLQVDSYLGSTTLPISIRVQGTQVDSDTGNLIQADLDQTLDYSSNPDVPAISNLRYNITVNAVSQVAYYTFIHDRYGDIQSRYPTLPNSQLASIAQNLPIYYAVTAVYWNSDTLEEIETALSADVSGIPLQVTPSLGSLPTVTRQQVTQDLIGSIFTSHPDVAVQPGSVLRDTFIDPMASESERLGFIMDFIHKAQSFSTLLSIDDPNLTGASVAVRQSTYKLALAQAFRLTNLNQVQAIIDLSFDKLASNVGKTREPGQTAQGEVLFYLKQPPAQSINLPIGTVVQAGSVAFTTTSNASFNANNIGAYYDPSTGWYVTRSFVQCSVVGVTGNVPATAIKSVAIPSVFVTNEANTFGGAPQESNYALATRCSGALYVDTGTYQGYKNSAFAIPGVQDSQIISAGSPYMLRDLSSTGVHTGGKVDCWVRGTQPTTYTDSFAFSYQNVFGASFEVVGNAQDLILRVVLLNPDGTSQVTEQHPLTEILSSGIRNVSRGYSFSLTNIQYLSADTIQLASGYNDPLDISVSDVIQGDFRYQTSNKHVFARQPVDYVVELKGQTGVSGTVNPNQYTLFKLESPFLLGESSLASDYLQVTSGGTLGSVVSVTGEQHVLVSNYPKKLNWLGVNELTIVVKSTDGLTTYKPVTPYEAAPDYRLVAPADPAKEAWAIERTENSKITSGQTVVVTYQHNENFSVKYNTNLVVALAQNNLNQTKHLTADVVVKQCNVLPVNIAATVVLQAGTSKDIVDARVRATLQNLIANSQSLRQSNVSKAIEGVQGVSYVVTPLSQLSLADGTMILQEALQTSQAGDVTLLPTWSTSVVKTYLIQDILAHTTSIGGGDPSKYRAVTQSGVALQLLTQTPNLTGQPLSQAAGQALIIGSAGLSILGYSDDVTLRPQVVGYPQWYALDQKVLAGTATLVEQQQYLQYSGEVNNNVQTLRASLTGNRVVVSLTPEQLPSQYSYAVTYLVEGETGARDIDVGLFDTLASNIFTLTYDEDQQARRGTR